MKKSILLDGVYGKFTVGAGIPVIGDNDKEIGITNGDGTVTITDPEIISLIEEKGKDVISFVYKEEKS